LWLKPREPNSFLWKMPTRKRGARRSQAGKPEAEDEVEPDDESLDDAAFIEESEEEDTDVTEIIGGDIENEEET
jgi:hypothetical protein